MAVFNKVIHFDADEIEKCSKVDNGIILWVSERHPVQQKVPYTEVLFPKLIDAVNGRGNFSMAEQPKKSGRSNGVMYVYCNHLKASKIRQGVVYTLKDHEIGKSLEMNFKMKCLDCEGNIVHQQAPVETPAVIHPPQNHAENLGRSPDFMNTMQRIDNSLILLVENIKNECMQYENPMQKLLEKTAIYGIAANQAVVEAISSVYDPLYADAQAQLDIPYLTPAAVILRDEQLIPSTTATSSGNSVITLGDDFHTSLAVVVSSSGLTNTTSTAGFSNSRAITTVTQIHPTPLTSTIPFITPVSPAIVTPTVTPPMPTINVTPTAAEPQPTTVNTLLPTTTVCNVIPTPTETLPITPTFSTVHRSLRSAEKAATEAAQHSTGETIVATPKSGIKRSSRALLAQKKQDDNMQKKSRGI